MIAKDAAIKQIQRLSGLDNFPRYPDQAAARAELLTALRRTAENEEHAKRIVSDWIDEHSFAPRPHELLAQRRRPQTESRIERGCGWCSQGGWMDWPALYVADADCSTLKRRGFLKVILSKLPGEFASGEWMAALSAKFVFPAGWYPAKFPCPRCWPDEFRRRIGEVDGS